MYSIIRVQLQEDDEKRKRRRRRRRATAATSVGLIMAEEEEGREKGPPLDATVRTDGHRDRRRITHTRRLVNNNRFALSLFLSHASFNLFLPGSFFSIARLTPEISRNPVVWRTDRKGIFSSVRRCDRSGHRTPFDDGIRRWRGPVITGRLSPPSLAASKDAKQLTLNAIIKTRLHYGRLSTEPLGAQAVEAPREDGPAGGFTLSRDKGKRAETRKGSSGKYLATLRLGSRPGHLQTFGPSVP